LINRLFFKNS